MQPNGTITIVGKCLDVTGSGTANGTKIQLYRCNGTGAQQWVYDTDRSLLNPNSKKCLDVPNSQANNNVQLQIYTCNDSKAQQWITP